ncbi:zinc finger CW-type PWWP domain protein 1-like [Achroia grisella]|uniref:zinc finger CW-type PWWP domain protein 1-like n=1 Tax=Achroia grisella TaxID=688607 RepID=UPI0027D258CC|nr:zinc finger CW-type PWWP domain protein 1-like [Achroia grisella]XP_059057110.1 zinc finger CW-type PWWP domain protein 1-like [Achroia grisella]XP_059057111.1 zinc finger CW-type PWWP domain protein 1-like [Achroia grisella]XP_059057112.1 zinc finger CW-type PWWP domain protein 1-like [Achroia grisella]XP_059057113.1 zinc finger CW-type PWWP domain protein 1-like [Achroia grisella]
METVNLPTENAQEPSEEAQQPTFDTNMSFKKSKAKKNNIRFSTTAENPVSQTNSYKDFLSQPAAGLSHRERLLWLQRRRTSGLWVQCDDCDRWRYLDHVIDSRELPEKWYCRMNPDNTIASCSAPEAAIPLRDEEDLIHSEYSAGSVVWARLPGWPWWPGMVDDCPDTEQFYWLDGFSDIPTYYNVVFFDSLEVTRAWIKPNQLKPYSINKKKMYNVLKNKKYMKRLEAAARQAEDANMLPLENRLSKYSFINRYNGSINEPKKIMKESLKKFTNQLKRKLHIELSSESSCSDSEYDKTPPKITSNEKSNVTILGKPKEKNITKNRVINNNIDVNTITPEDISAESQLLDDTNTSTSAIITVNAKNPPDSMAVQIGNSQVANDSSVDGLVPKMHIINTDKDTSVGSPRSSRTGEVLAHIPSSGSDDFEF